MYYWICRIQERHVTQAAGDPGQEAFRKVHGVGNADDGQPAADAHGPLEQVVQHLLEYQFFGLNTWQCSL